MNQSILNRIRPKSLTSSLKPRIFYLFVYIAFAANIAAAEFNCKCEVQYRWQRSALPENKPADTEATPAVKGEAAKKDGAAPEDKSDAAEDTGHTVYWMSLEAKAPTEEEARQKLNKAALNERAGAEKACRNAHENLSGCIASKYSSLSSSVGTLGFSARKSVEDAINSDCKLQQGRCLGSVVTEVKCSEKIEAKPEEAEPESKEGKDKKGKKK